MPFVFPWENPLLGLFPDECISFNTNRPPFTISNFPRTVVTLPPSSDKGTIIPSVRRKVDAHLLKHIKKIQNWQRVKRHSFEHDKKLFSLLWKFRMDNRSLWAALKTAKPLRHKEAKVVKKAIKRHISSLENRLRPGNVFLVPDSEMAFNDPRRLAMPYARHVLLYAIYPGQVLIIPFSTRIGRMDPDLDILVDKAHSGPALKPGTRPVVENFPYRMFSKPTVACLRAIQPFTVQDFLAAALTYIGAVRSELLNFIANRMKNILPNP